MRLSGVLLCLLLVGCAVPESAPRIQTEPQATVEPVTPTPVTTQGCPHLDPKLIALVQARDWPAFAQANGIQYFNGSVRVIVHVQSGGDVPLGYGTRSETRAGDAIQTVVPITQLCSLSNDPTVTGVNVPTPTP